MKKISDFNNATDKYPVIYAGSATRPEFVDMPTTLQQQEGVAPMDTLPAQWWNAMWKLATRDINAFRDYVGDSITEINNLLTKFGITLDDANSEQLYDFFHNDYVQNFLNDIFVNKSGDTIDGDLHVKGNLSVDGIGEEIISTELKVGSNTITLRDGNPTALGNTELAGVVTENYDGNNHNNIISIDKNGVARTGDIDIATRILYSNNGTNFFTDENLTIPATIGTDEKVRDTGNQTSGGVKIYEGVTYSNNDTQALATREDNPVDGALMKWDAATKKLVSANISVQFDLAWPIGVTYVQYPQQASPMDLWGDFSTWEVVDYDGAFFRAEGTNADAFIEESGVLSKQESQNKAHSHGMDDAGGHKHDRGDMEISGDINHLSASNTSTGAFYISSSYYGSNPRITSDSDARTVSFLASKTWTGNTSENGSHSHTVHNDGGSESRPENYTIRIWKRTA